MNSFDDLSSSRTPSPIIYNNAFDLTYDNAGIFNLSTEFSYVSGKDLSVVLKGNYYNYKLDLLPFAPQKPNFDLTASAGFRIIDRLTGFTDLEVTGKRKAMAKYYSPISSAIPSNKEFSMDPSIRLNLGATYEMTSKFKLFGRVDNLLNRQNEQWLGYASQGLRLLAGVTYSF
jgi:outer membrane receptor protein involved in Fe transport